MDHDSEIEQVLARAEGQAADGKLREAIDQARRALALADRPGTPVPERLHALLARWTGDLVHHYEAVLARPDDAAARSALGQALARAGRSCEARPHLERALAADPSDREATAALERLAARSEGRPKISLCLIVKNEEENLPACLASVEGLADEVVVVDTGSTDRTRELAARAGARMVSFTWVDDFAAARNEGLRHATGDWVFWLDADDRLDDAGRGKLRTLFDGLADEPGNVAYVMKCLCAADPAEGSATVVDHIRLFRNHPEARWRYRVHEQILPALRRLARKSAGPMWSSTTSATRTPP